MICGGEGGFLWWSFVVTEQSFYRRSYCIISRLELCFLFCLKKIETKSSLRSSWVRFMACRFLSETIIYSLLFCCFIANEFLSTATVLSRLRDLLVDNNIKHYCGKYRMFREDLLVIRVSKLRFSNNNL